MEVKYLVIFIFKKSFNQAFTKPLVHIRFAFARSLPAPVPVVVVWWLVQVTLPHVHASRAGAAAAGCM